MDPETADQNYAQPGHRAQEAARRIQALAAKPHQVPDGGFWRASVTGAYSGIGHGPVNKVP